MSSIHPAVLDAFMNGATIHVPKRVACERPSGEGLSPDERAGVALVSARLRRKSA